MNLNVRIKTELNSKGKNAMKTNKQPTELD